MEENTISQYGYIDRTGAFVIKPAFNQGGSFSEGLAAVETSARVVGNDVVDIAWGFIDKSGKLAIPAKYESAGKFSEGLARVAVHDGDGTGYVNRDGKVVISLEFTRAGDFSEGLAVACNRTCAYIDRSGVRVIKGVGFFWPFSGGLAVAGEFHHWN